MTQAELLRPDWRAIDEEGEMVPETYGLPMSLMDLAEMAEVVDMME